MNTSGGNMNKILFVLLLILASTFNSQSAFSYDDQVTHPDITKIAVQHTMLNTYLSHHLGPEFSQGYDTVINGVSVMNWIREGSIAEDAELCRRANHFHNPLKPWNESYNNDLWWPEPGCAALGWLKRYSNVTWATGFLAPPSDGQKETFGYTPPPQNWDVARNYYYFALTSNLYRTLYFTKTFKALGQVMHLLEDMAVPAHTRNDFASHLISGAGQPFEHYVKAHPGLVSQSNPVFPSFSSNKLTNFWDTDKYNGSNPSTLLDVGLAEFSNANYLSDYTIPNNGTTPEHAFPYPYISSSNTSGPNYQICSYQLFPGAQVNYISRMNLGPCPADIAAADHFAVVSLLNPSGYPDENSYAYYWLDDNVHNTYAKELLPRAVGYSAALLNYFFRGELGVTVVSGGLKIKNLSAEDMAPYVDQATNTTIGTISVYYDDIYTERRLLASYDLTAPLAPGEEITISFTQPTDNIAPNRYIVVFRGKLGNEEGAVIGKVAVPPPLYYVATTPTGDKIYKIDADGTNQTVVHDNIEGYVLGRIALTPDGGTLAFSSSPDGTVDSSVIRLLDLLDTSATPTVLTSGNWPSWSPDGKKIAFEREVTHSPYSADIEIFTVNVETGVEAQLTNVAGSSYSGQPAWSPTGNTIAYTKYGPTEANCDTEYVIYLMDASGNPVGPLTCPPAGEYMSVGDLQPDWSPDGQEIAYARKRYVGQSFQIHKVNVSTGAITKLTDSPDVGYDELGAAWSGDGTTIAVGSGRDGDFDVWLISAQASGYQTNLTNSNSGTDGYPVFGK